MELHFLKVGNGDCTIIKLPDGNLMMVDICNGGGKNPELTDPVDYVSRLTPSWTKPELSPYVQTHPDMDHMDGLAVLKEKCLILNFWDTPNEKPSPDFNSSYSKGSPEDWKAYQELRKDAAHHYRKKSPVFPGGVKQTKYKVYVLHPTEEAVKEANESDKWNNASYVLLITSYVQQMKQGRVVKEKEFKALIAGDIETSVWEELHEWANTDETIKALVSNITVFRVSHHGRKTGFCGEDWLNLTKPKEIVISKGSVPEEESACKDYRKYLGNAGRLWLTSQDDVICTYDPNSVRHSIRYRE
jgi:beta-lactamase superfamily II metal-dependent hydrolase